ncbi:MULTISPECIES: ROK family transcriptional regulator [unclassified Pseudonocardia]|uniref:ROK family transcriptional regulator n=1 Tax=unclassified Pseudonocardia TaxID=2619320 RepID=UPI0001FFE65A|nr:MULTISPECIES: ROK family transcriptional regulator [unclassified Pseudonocardia]ALE73402.1 ROK family transcriptional regulator [Pseudonocardia sp. EC080625-04]ALL77084.1 ROK family transcriptional regulator [Pseudonocardia sp. EC080610-09]ALL79997.1 ROK family transcriptional regulator [Pseudonocardia sp. EC080619-01]OLM18420.1 Transcriptional regulator, ROK family [Pseudonocardia sp. Ae707_Ps1]
MRGRTPTSAPATAGEIFRLVRDGVAATRTEIGRETGLSRTAVAARVDRLLSDGLVTEVVGAAATGGRPAARLEFNAAGGTVLALSVGVSRSKAAVCDLAGTILAEGVIDQPAAVGPERLLGDAVTVMEKLLLDAGVEDTGIRGIGLSIPGAVDRVRGWSVGVPSLPGWEHVPLAPLLTERFPAPVRVDNDVNAMALAEHDAHPDVDDLLMVKIGSGVGAGLVSGGFLQRGAWGAAGEIGHTPVQDGPGIGCGCGNVDCLEVLASGRALVRDLSDGRPEGEVTSIADVVELVKRGDPDAVRLVRIAGRRLGEVLAAAVNLVNPALVAIGGDLVGAFDPLVAGVREAIYRRSMATATQNLRIEPGLLAGRSGVTGCAILVLDDVLSAGSVDATLSA